MPVIANAVPLRLQELLRYEEETGKFFWLVNRKGHVRAGDEAGRLTRNGYISIGVDGVEYLAHRLAWVFTDGNLDPAEQIDHVNGVRSDNRRENLRKASHRENCYNSKVRAHNKCGIKGVRKMRSKWAARIRVDGREVWLGVFETPEEAKAAYDEAAFTYHKEFAKA